MDAKESEGEDLIAEYFEGKDIKFQRQVEIPGLMGDDKFFRVADFYLTKYKIFIEFFGMWNVEGHKARYAKKMQIYEKNNIPCLFFYPDNLGILDFIFMRRLKKVLKQYGLKKGLRRWFWDYFRKQYALIIIIFAVLVIITKESTPRIILIFLLIAIIINGLKDTWKAMR